jgi:galactokinase
LAQPDIFCARLTGDGVWRIIVALSRRDGAAAVARRIASAYAKRVSRRSTILIP